MMPRSTTSVPADLPDLVRFSEQVRARVASGVWAQPRPGCQADPAVWVARAPGRLDVMGGIADYSGARVLQWPIREATCVAIRPWSDPRLEIVSVSPDGRERRCDVPLDVVATADKNYDGVHAWFTSRPDHLWAAYVAGVFTVLAREEGIVFDSGAAILIASDVPEGKGVSSSAALESASMEAVTAAWRVILEPRRRAMLCQMVENRVVGAPCGVMDQMASTCGEAGSLMELLCQPAEFLGTVRVPAELGFWGIDSGIRHAVTGADYHDVRVGAFMGYRILAELAGLRVASTATPGLVTVEDTEWNGYLANVGSETFAHYESRLPESLGGAEFLHRFGGITDTVTRVDPTRTYAVRIPTGHPVYEHERVTEWARQLRRASTARVDAVHLGRLMYESHASYSACGLGSHGTDRLVELTREAGPDAGVYGAKITGGGSGGTVAVLADSSAEAQVRAIAAQYASETGHKAHIFRGSSPGSATVGAVRLNVG